MPVGYLVTVVLVGCAILVALAPPRRPPGVATLGFLWSVAVTELPFLAFAYLLVTTLLAFGAGDVDSLGGWVTFGGAVLVACGVAVIAWRGARARPVVEDALREGLGAGWRAAPSAAAAGGTRKPNGPRRRRWGRILLGPFPVRGPGVRRVKNIQYGDAGRRNLLDVYHGRSRPTGGPILIHLHGGRYRGGRKSTQSLPLLHRLAGHGWVCVSANYRLRPDAGLREHLVDAKKVITWAREHGPEYGADPSRIFVAGSSAGAHLMALAALTAGDPAHQPGFEAADTSAAAVVCLGGYYGDYDAGPDWRAPSSPLGYLRPDAPPFFVAHGDRDTVVAVESARDFAARLRAVSASPVVYAELPGSQHGFDLFHSPRFEAVVDGIESFAAWVSSRASTQA
ncbi:alpha/beta hydrolase [Frankia sp. CNm7]|uniref:Alpha/beta hydrolase n=1 Tax=Frankia nepalensis TaxID=1836974 RepID=A0A937RDN6_9ACTN|nr:alpha/beta hydrolase [Frankia nepalensis]MBL7500438.1 alpha/beta hydrolase [Frankia nepalensis]MBL7511201.1 alpha/beta hydrolase [Frankia nepalensis]MBL7522285.1 alpha/beta hydrolase [Frankia nepalensis]MBL7626959.1 alpha/beta hydrolase [Frankia nepalensis]